MIMHIDMNSFFASVEQQTQPRLRGKPVVVLAYVSDRGCVLASSIEAKRDFGIRTGMTYAQARERCPQVVGLASDPKKYRAYSEAFMQLCNQYSPLVEQYSIDEAFLNIDWVARSVEQSRVVACEIKQRITSEIGDWIRVSIGIAPTRFLAKLAGDSQKPDGLVILDRPQIPEWYRNRDVQSAWGIGPSTGKQLRSIGINTLYELYFADSVLLYQLLGKNGYALWAKVRAMEIEHLETDRVTDQKSISAQYSLPFRTMQPEDLRSVLMKMCERVGRRLRRQGKIAGRVFCFWRCHDTSGEAMHEDFSPKFQESYPLFTSVLRMFSARRVHSNYRLIGLGVSQLSPAGLEQQLFALDKGEQITGAMDHINNRYGEYTVFHGAMMDGRSYAQDTVGFRKVNF